MAWPLEKAAPRRRGRRRRGKDGRGEERKTEGIKRGPETKRGGHGSQRHQPPSLFLFLFIHSFIFPLSFLRFLFLTGILRTKHSGNIS